MIFRETFTRFSNVDECRAVGIFVPLFISEGLAQDVPKMHQQNKQKRPNIAGLSTFQSGPKGSKSVRNGKPRCF